MYVGEVYCLTSPEGKKYVGQTINLGNRIRQHRHSPKRSKTILAKAIGKYGFDNFEVEVLEVVKADTEASLYEKLYELEKRYVEELNSVIPNGYNVSIGGPGNPGWEWDDEYRERVLKAREGTLVGNRNGMYGKKWTPEHREKVMKSREEFYESERGEELAKRRSESMKGAKNYFYGMKNGDAPSAREVYCLELGMIFPTIKQACSYIYELTGVKITRSNVSVTCDRSDKYTKFRWGVKGFNFRKTTDIVSYGNLVPSRFEETEGVETIPERE